MLDENTHWLLSYYRVSEISGALFFGRLARNLRPGSIQIDMTRHFAEESMHAHYWTDCIARCAREPLAIGHAYQDRYLASAGVPANIMEVLAITHVFEKRVVRQYTVHARTPGVLPEVQATLRRILQDERWHLLWVRQALDGLEAKYGVEQVAATLARCEAADRDVYATAAKEHEERLSLAATQKRRL